MATMKPLPKRALHAKTKLKFDSRTSMLLSFVAKMVCKNYVFLDTKINIFVSNIIVGKT